MRACARMRMCACDVTALCMQVPCHAIAMAPSLGYCIGQLSALQGLDVHGFEGSIAVYASHGQPPALLSFTCCHQLQWLDISHWAVTEPEVSKAAGMTAGCCCLCVQQKACSCICRPLRWVLLLQDQQF